MAINHIDGTRHFTIYEDFVELCIDAPNPVLAAGILNLFEQETERAYNETLISNELFGAYNLIVMRENLHWLVDQLYIMQQGFSTFELNETKINQALTNQEWP